jgi:hypothetical protein
VNTAVTITGVISRTLIELAVLGTFLKIALVVAPRFQIAAPKAPVQPKPERDAAAEAPKITAAEAPKITGDDERHSILELGRTA